tara:strand:- start:168 stop:608 length:441 start_codon:yes stop_codon:yes gene_type:complete
MKNYKVNIMNTGGKLNQPEFGPKHISMLDPFIITNQYIIWAKINTSLYNSFLKIKKGDILHILKSKSDKEKVYYKGEVLSDLIIDDEYKFSKKILKWDWNNMTEEHIGKKELKYIIHWEKQPYPDEELYNKINRGFNAKTVKEIFI